VTTPSWLKPAALQATLVVGAIAIVAPVLYVVSVSLRSPAEYFVHPYGFLPQHPTLANFRAFLDTTDVRRLMTNSLIIVVLSSIGTVISCAIVAYPLARLRFRGATLFTILVLATMMLPPQVLLIPQYILFVKLHWIDTFYPLIVPSWFATSGFFVFFLRQSFRMIPREIEEAVLVDGGRYWTAFWRVIIPMSKTPLMIVLILQTVTTYNDFFAPSIYLHSLNKLTMPIGIDLAAQTASGISNAPVIMAGTLIYVVPLLVFFLLVQRWLVRGVQLGGAVKG
jgi:multiple sugar transport system permease protein